MISILRSFESGSCAKNRLNERDSETRSREITRANAWLIWIIGLALIVLGTITTYLINAIAGFVLFLIGLAVLATNSLAFKIKESETDTIQVERTGNPAQYQNMKPEPIPVYPKSITTIAVCPNCKSNIPDSVTFCPFCGRNLQTKEDTPVLAACPNCKMLIPADAKFCPFCTAEIHTT